MAIDPDKSRRATEQHARKRAERNSRWCEDINGIVYIPLTQGQVAIIDAADMERAQQYKWHARRSGKNQKKPSFYAEAAIPGHPDKAIFLHHLILPPVPGLEPDHIDRNGLNCTRKNLRYATPSQNAANRVTHRNRRPYRGVYKTSDDSPWRAKLMVNGKYFHRCGFETPEGAAEAYNSLAIEHYGEFAMLNKIPEGAKANNSSS